MELENQELDSLEVPCAEYSLKRPSTPGPAGKGGGREGL